MGSASNFDVILVGLGPSGRALASRCATKGMTVAAVDPHPHRPWTSTFACWSDELPAYLPDAAVAHRIRRPAAWTTRLHIIDRELVVLDNATLQRFLDLSAVSVIEAKATQVTSRSVTLADGAVLHGCVIDARGPIVDASAPHQSAYGLFVPKALAEPILDGAEALFMDWRTASNDAPGSFLYAIPVDSERVLLEETCLAGQPALSLATLKARLVRRLASHGIEVPTHADEERVYFSLAAGRPRPLAFGARGGLMHAASGFSVATSLSEAERLAAALAKGKDPTCALWPLRSRAVQRLRSIGLATLLTMSSGSEVRDFFAVFFELPPKYQRAYLSQRNNLRGTTSAMTRMFRKASNRQRRIMISSAIRAGSGPPSVTR